MAKMYLMGYNVMAQVDGSRDMNYWLKGISKGQVFGVKFDAKSLGKALKKPEFTNDDKALTLKANNYMSNSLNIHSTSAYGLFGNTKPFNGHVASVSFAIGDSRKHIEEMYRKHGVAYGMSDPSSNAIKGGAESVVDLDGNLTIDFDKMIEQYGESAVHSHQRDQGLNGQQVKTSVRFDVDGIICGQMPKSITIKAPKKDKMSWFRDYSPKDPVGHGYELDIRIGFWSDDKSQKVELKFDGFDSVNTHRNDGNISLEVDLGSCTQVSVIGNSNQKLRTPLCSMEFKPTNEMIDIVMACDGTDIDMKNLWCQNFTIADRKAPIGFDKSKMPKHTNFNVFMKISDGSENGWTELGNGLVLLDPSESKMTFPTDGYASLTDKKINVLIQEKRASHRDGMSKLEKFKNFMIFGLNKDRVNQIKTFYMDDALLTQSPKNELQNNVSFGNSVKLPDGKYVIHPPMFSNLSIDAERKAVYDYVMGEFQKIDSDEVFFSTLMTNKKNGIIKASKVMKQNFEKLLSGIYNLFAMGMILSTKSKDTIFTMILHNYQAIDLNMDENKRKFMVIRKVLDGKIETHYINK